MLSTADSGLRVLDVAWQVVSQKIVDRLSEDIIIVILVFIICTKRKDGAHQKIYTLWHIRQRKTERGNAVNCWYERRKGD